MEHEPPARYARARGLVEAVSAGDTRTGIAGALDRVCSVAATELELDGASVHLMAGTDHKGVAACSGPRSREWGEVTFTAGEGPCLDAWRTRRPVLVPDLAAQASRWPGYSAVLLDGGVGCVLALPLSVGAVGFGVLEAYGAARPTVDNETAGMLTALGQVATEVLLDGRGVDGSGALELSAALDHRIEIHQAQGMVMVALQVSLMEALLRMRAHSFAANLTLLALASDVVAGHADPREWMS